MQNTAVGKQVAIKNILYLTDLSQPSEAALPFAAMLACRYRSKVHALHVLTPDPAVYTTSFSTDIALKAAEEAAYAEMRSVDSQLAGLPHEVDVTRDLGVWPAVDRTILEENIDLIVLGTHGRTGSEKLLFGSVAEEILRRSCVPVLTIGPKMQKTAHNGGRFHRILFATDFTHESLAAAPYALSLAQENDARLSLLVVVPKPPELNERDTRIFDISVAEAIHRLYEIVPPDSKLAFPPDVIVKFGEPGQQIVEVAIQRGADLIVLGVRDARGRIGAATHLERSVAHKVVAHASCPVLTVRG
jgi:nucleotide-binding universal stress UspA family protein